MASFAAISPVQVRGIIDTELSDAQIESSISTAMILIEDNLSGYGTSSNTLVEITMYTAAHYVSLRDNTTSIRTEKIGDASVEYQTGAEPIDFMSLKSTKWGAVALSLDKSGILQQLGMKKPRLVSLDIC